MAEVVLASTAQGSPLMGENAAARIAQLNILDALFVAVAQRDVATTDANLRRTMDSVSPSHRRRAS
jgi:DNA-binding MurR/RpiR family transcriptional regulator